MTIHKIVLTGGPCGGKSSSIELLSSSLENNGYKVFVVPEAATFLFSHGVDLRVLDHDMSITLQENMLKFIISMENAFYDIAKSTGRNCVLLCDRGAMDGRAFSDPKVWAQVMERLKLGPEQLKDRYDAVLHLMSAASGSEEYYTLENNKARSETVEQAREIDCKIKDVWLGHPHLRIIESCSDFSSKMRNVLNAVYRVVGIPEPVEIERKFLLNENQEVNIPVAYIESYIEQNYLLDNSRVRARHFNGLIQYTHTIKKEISSGKRHEIENRISYNEYVNLLNKANPDYKPIKKLRKCFIWDSQYFELDIFVDPHMGLKVLELELDSEEQKISLPPFLSINREVTDDSHYSNINLAKRI